MDPAAARPTTAQPPPLPATVLPAPISPAIRALFIAAASLAAVFIGLVTLVLLGFSTGLVGLLGGIVLALLPLPFYMLLALWIDRFEKEPIWMLASAFIWGATIAVFVAFILNSLFAGLVSPSLQDYTDLATATLSAPLIEELAKGLALFVFYYWQRDEFDSVIDGILYAAMVGLGFAMTENILYYGKVIAAGNLGDSVFVFFLRGIVSPFAHPFFTSMTGIGLGLARQASAGSPMKILAPATGLCLAMALHLLWNLSAGFGALFFAAYVLIMFPAFLGLLLLIFFSLRKESRILRQYLAAELQSGLVDARGYEALCTISGRLRESCQALGHGGFGKWRARTEFHRLASELAFHRWRTARGILPRAVTPAAREAAFLQELRALKSRLG